MKKIIYIKPEIEVAAMRSDSLMQEYSVAIDGTGIGGGGSSTPIVDDDPEEIFGKDNKNMWDGWED